MEINLNATWRPLPTDESNLVTHAYRELELAGWFRDEPEIAESLVAAVRAFASYGHSGGSAPLCINMLHQLLNFKPLTPITSDPDEWLDVSGVCGKPTWQNIRDSSCFSEDGGKTWYSV